MIETRELTVRFGPVVAVDRVSLALPAGQVLGLVGESGSGKSTLARALVGLVPFRGRVLVRGEEWRSLPAARRRRVQMVFQDPFASLNPRMTVRELVTEPWQIHDVLQKERWETELTKLLEMVGLEADHADRHPHQFSGGQRQRICIARALALRPKLVICDEAVSALDVSIQAQILNLLKELQQELGLAYVFISHDLSVVRHVCDRVAVMYLGKIMEIGNRDAVYELPTNPYTQALLSAAPVAKPWLAEGRKEIVLEGDIPSPANPPSGCRFRTRCWKAEDICATEEPALEDRGHDHPSACHFAEVDTEVIPQTG
jgi:oligopeptide transport system ATP-binding protein